MTEQSTETIAPIFERLGRRLDANTTDGARERVAAIGGRRQPAAVGRAESPIPVELRDALGLRFDAPALDPGPGEGEVGTARFEMHSGAAVVPIEVVVDLTTNSPYQVISGTFFFPGIEFSHWQITFGRVGFALPDTSQGELSSDLLILEAQFLPRGGDPTELAAQATSAPTVTLIGLYRPPATYPGLYFSDGGQFFQTTLFMGWQPQV